MCYILILVSTLNTYTKHLPNVFLVESVPLAHVSTWFFYTRVVPTNIHSQKNKR